MLIMRSQNTARKTSFSGFSDYGIPKITHNLMNRRRPRYLSGFGQDDTAWDVLNTNQAEGGQTINYPNDSSYPSPSDIMQEQFPVSTVAAQPVYTNESSYPSGEEVSQMPVSSGPSGPGLCDDITCQAQGGACNSGRTQCVQPYVSATPSNVPIQIPKSSVPVPSPTAKTTPSGTPNPTPGILDTLTNLVVKTLNPTAAGTIGGLPPKAGYMVQRNATTGQYQYVPISSTTAKPSSLSSMLPFLLIGGVGIAAIMILKK
jgi:hypothetical protein